MTIKISLYISLFCNTSFLILQGPFSSILFPSKTLKANMSILVLMVMLIRPFAFQTPHFNRSFIKLSSNSDLVLFTSKVSAESVARCYL